MSKIKKVWAKYGLYICLMCCMVGIAGYFVNLILFQNKKDILNVLVLSSQINSDALADEIEKVVEVDADEEISIKYMDTKGNEANRAIVLTWIRAKTVDIIISEKNQIEFFAENGCLKELKEGKTEYCYYDNSIINYDSDGGIIGREEERHYGIYVDGISGVEFQTQPIVSLAVNLQNVDNARRVLDFYINQK